MGKAARLKRALRLGQAGVKVHYVDGTVDVKVFADPAEAQRLVDQLRPLAVGGPDQSGIARIEVLDAASVRELVQRHGR